MLSEFSLVSEQHEPYTMGPIRTYRFGVGQVNI